MPHASPHASVPAFERREAGACLWILVCSCLIVVCSFLASWLLHGHPTSAAIGIGLALALAPAACLWLVRPRAHAWILALVGLGLTYPAWSLLVARVVGETLASTGVVPATLIGLVVALGYRQPVMGGIIAIAIVPAWLLALITGMVVPLRDMSALPGRAPEAELAGAWWSILCAVSVCAWALPERGRLARDRSGVTCRHCGYDLAGLDATVCPECGGSQRRPDAPRRSNILRPDGRARSAGSTGGSHDENETPDRVRRSRPAVERVPRADRGDRA